MIATPALPADPATPWLALLRHPATPCASVQALQVHLRRDHAHRLQLTYQLRGGCASILLPKRSEHPGPEPELWRHTCFEAFLGAGNSGAYHEFNFSPSGDWAVFAFSAWRRRTADCSQALQPVISVSTAATGICMHVDLPLPATARRQSGLLLGLSAVIEHADGRRCYWALAHPCDDPDFHARAGWLYPLPPAPPDTPRP
ncbi:MAG: DOMON-like domain-containing protein [Ottowia sp.]|nr:DOMON-like domain-containing protein [Ottowia sp.]